MAKVRGDWQQLLEWMKKVEKELKRHDDDIKELKKKP